VQKFFTRETTYSQLLQAVSENEEKLDHLRRDNEQVTEKLNELQMQDSDQQQPIEIEGGRSANPEIHQLHVKIQSAQKLYEKTIEMAKKVELTNTNVRDWLNRIIKKIDQQFGENIGNYNEDEKTMSFRFEKVMQAIIKRLD
jgi:predicted nuclease with TOPRIM domain